MNQNKKFGIAIGPLDPSAVNVREIFNGIDILNVQQVDDLPIAIIEVSTYETLKNLRNHDYPDEYISCPICVDQFPRNAKELWPKMASFLDGNCLNLSKIQEHCDIRSLSKIRQVSLNLLLIAAIFFRNENKINNIEKLDLSFNNISNTQIDRVFKAFFPKIKSIDISGNDGLIEEIDSMNFRDLEVITNTPQKQTESPQKQTESPQKQTESPQKQTESPQKQTEISRPLFLKRPPPNLLVHSPQFMLSDIPSVRIDSNSPLFSFISKFFEKNCKAIERIGPYYSPDAVLTIDKDENVDFPKERCGNTIGVSKNIQLLQQSFPNGFISHVTHIFSKLIKNDFYSINTRGAFQDEQEKILGFNRTFSIVHSDNTFIITNDIIIIRRYRP